MIVTVQGVSFDVDYNKDSHNIERITIAGADDNCDYNLIDVLSENTFVSIFKRIHEILT